MPVFTCEAIDQGGQKVQKEIDASSKDDAIKKLKSQGLRPTRVMPLPGQKGAAKSDKGKKKGSLFSRVTSQMITTFTTQLATLQDAGLPIVRSIKVLENQQRPGKFRDQLSQVAEDVESGSTFSEALAKFPKTFDVLYVSMVKAGEAGGVLDVILNRLSGFMEKSQKLKKKIKGAMVYPVAVICVAGGILAVIMTFVVPSFEAMFKDMGQNLPAPTQLLLSISNAIRGYWFLFPIVFFAIFFAWRLIVRSKQGKAALDKFKLRMPIFGNIINKGAIARFCRTLGTLIASGVPILEALRIVKDAVGNIVIANAIEEVHGSIREGETIADPLRTSGVFDDLIVNMIDVGEETGELDKMLMKIADNYEADVDVAVEGLSSLLEPLIIVGLGGTVGFIVIALFLPLINIIQSVGAK